MTQEIENQYAELMKIKGVGRTLAEIVVSYSGSINNLRHRSKKGILTTLLRMPRIDQKRALAIYNHLNLK